MDQRYALPLRRWVALSTYLPAIAAINNNSERCKLLKMLNGLKK